MTTPTDAAIAPVAVTITIDRPADVVFELFTARIGEWWPLARHSVTDDRAETCVMQPGVGGRIFERDRDGNAHDWGRITEWSPPARLSFTWHPGRGSDRATTVTVTLDPLDDDRCHFRLVHDGWAAYGTEAEHIRRSYDDGWRALLNQQFAGFAHAA